MKQTGRPYKQHSWNEKYDAIVIGSGIGGMTAAALLAKHAGKKVLLLERHYVAGGFTHSFQRPGYEWDVGLHYIGQVREPTMPCRRAFDHLTERRLQWNQMPEIYERIRIAGSVYEFPSGAEKFRNRMNEYFPAESAAIDRYLGAVFAVARASGLYFAEKALPRSIARLLGGFMRSGFLRYASRTTAQVMREFTRNQELIGVLTGQWMDYGLPPSQSSFGIHALIAHHYLEGAGYPVGGSSEIAASIAPLIERTGGQILVSAEVAEIVLDTDQSAIGVRMADGREVRAKCVISDAGAYNTFSKLLPASLSPAIAFREEIKKIPPSASHLCLYVGIERKESEPELNAANLWVHSSYDHDANLARVLQDPEAPFPVLYFSFPSAKDPAFSEKHRNHSTVEVIAPIPYQYFSRWVGTTWNKRGSEYENFKQTLTEKLLQALHSYFPETKNRIDRSELSTPLSTQHFANYSQGEIYGLSAVPARFKLRSLGTRTAVRNLYLTGQDACTLGVSGALFGGVLTASAILGRNLMTQVLKNEARFRHLALASALMLVVKAFSHSL
jgi:all-trans-retinol 13,14-reductase